MLIREGFEGDWIIVPEKSRPGVMGYVVCGNFPRWFRMSEGRIGEEEMRIRTWEEFGVGIGRLVREREEGEVRWRASIVVGSGSDDIFGIEVVFGG